MIKKLFPEIVFMLLVDFALLCVCIDMMKAAEGMEWIPAIAFGVVTLFIDALTFFLALHS
jgi:hypothetical protein